MYCVSVYSFQANLFMYSGTQIDIILDLSRLAEAELFRFTLINGNLQLVNYPRIKFFGNSRKSYSVFPKRKHSGKSSKVHRITPVKFRTFFYSVKIKKYF